MTESQTIKDQALEEKFLEAEKTIKEIRCAIDMLNCSNREFFIERIVEIIHKTNIGAIGTS